MDIHEPENIVILGGGIVGVSTAYFLSKHYKELNSSDITINLIEKYEIASCASGVAGGFLARDFSDGTDIEELTKAGFKLHKDLAEELDGEKNYGYRSVSTYSLECDMKIAHETLCNEVDFPKELTDEDSIYFEIEWIKPKSIIEKSKIGSFQNSAQVTPKLLTQTLWKHAAKNGAELIIGSVVDVYKDSTQISNPKYTIKLLDGRKINASRIVLCLGPWTYYAREYSIFKNLPREYFNVYGLRAHNVVHKPQSRIPAQALFVNIVNSEYRDGDEIEFYPRPDGTIYVCGEALEDGVIVPNDLDLQKIGSEASFTKLRNIYNAFINSEKSTFISQNAGYLPIRNNGVPIISKIPQLTGIYLGSGHGCWGILNGPITGLLLSELVLEKPSSLRNLKKFSVDRFV
ncbi:putative oxidoreductase [Smittium mucronatum]|uniref:Putative oxidoreductase n=1 Tax=Smittium mucronatum TaxID=133383 RepID=A0A1R0GVT6_9FUNG|nr:putative oxidoreductase [Smittium mucronatum]